MPTFGELRARLLKLPYGAGTDLDLLDGLLNDRYISILRWHPWTRLEARSYILTTAIYSTGTIAVTNADDDITGTSTVWTTAMNGRKIRIANRDESYTFTYVTATTATIDPVYEGDTATAATYKIHQPIYALPSDLDTIQSIRVPGADDDLDEIDPEALDQIDPTRSTYGRPLTYARTEDTSQNLPQIELWPIPEDAEALPIRYIEKMTRLTEGDAEFPNWVSTEAIYKGTEADLLGAARRLGEAQLAESRFGALVQAMIREDNRRRIPEQLRMADRFTQHRKERALGHSLADKRRWTQMPWDE